MALLEVKNIRKAFAGNVAVDDVTMNVEEKCITGLIGANGAGKTTLFNCIAGYYPADRGEIYYKGKKIHHLKAQALCKAGIARTFQIAKPFGDLTVLENVAVGGYNRAKSKAEAMKYAHESLQFVGLDHKADTPAYLLNTGEQRKLELARAIATKPELLLLDEVMAGLTPSESVEMVELIRKIHKDGMTILMIEHIMPVVMSLSDHIYVLERGQLIAEGKPQEIVKDERVISSYLGKGME